MAGPRSKRTGCLARHGMVLMLLAGCAPAADRVDPVVEELVRSLRSEATAESSNFTHDLGTVLARGQTIRHEFTLLNPGDQPLRISGAEALTPCCSAVDALAVEVPPGGVVKIPVLFKPGFQTGRKQVQFAVRTDASRLPVKMFSLRASLLAEVEIAMLDGSDSSLLLGQSGTQRFRVTCRRVGEVGRGLPITVTGDRELTVGFVNNPDPRQLPDGLIESFMEIEACLSAQLITGHKATALTIHWANGTTHEHRLAWRIKPCVEAVPPALFIAGASEVGTQTIQLQSADRPFRVLGVRGPLSGPCTVPPEAATHHVLTLSLKEAIGDAGAQADDIVIETSHPAQPQVRVTVMTLSDREWRP